MQKLIDGRTITTAEEDLQALKFDRAFQLLKESLYEKVDWGIMVPPRRKWFELDD